MDGFLKKFSKVGKDAVLSEFKDLARSFLSKPAVKSNIHHFFFPKKTSVYSVQKVQAALDNAEWIFQFLRKNHIHPNRIGIDGLPGSGKSTLAEALSVRMNMQWVSLDYKLPEENSSLSQDLTIYEHHRLFRTQNLDIFDVLFFLDLSTETIKKQIIERGEGALHIELFDYELMQEIGKAIFELAKGEPIRVSGTDLLMKVRPQQGFALEQTLAEKLATKGFESTENLTQEEKLFLLVKGESRKGLSGYHQGGKYAREFLTNTAKNVFRSQACKGK
ncbi:MAG: hypothetical protein HOJ79_00215 [Nitrospina sp.]|nr:hypothetical protein [Nitrospina sp.]